MPIMKFAERGEVSQPLIKIVRNNVREADQVVGDIYSLAACNEAGDNRLQDMMDEFRLDDLEGLSDFIMDTSRDATHARIAALKDGTYQQRHDSRRI